MRKIEIALATSLTLCAGAAQAADMIGGEPAFELRSSISNWDGGYVGGQIGYRVGRAESRGLDPLKASADPKSSGTADLDTPTVGLRGGYDLEVAPSIVVGVAGDVNYGRDDSKKSADLGAAGRGESRLLQDWDASARLRAGVLVNENLLVYGTGGVALLGEKLSAEVESGKARSSFSESKTHLGWTIGAGVEAAIADDWRVFAEYRYAQFDTKTYRWEEQDVKAESRPRTHTILTGVNYAF